MNGNPFHKVQSGDKLVIPAQAYNAFIDAARAVRGIGDHGAGNFGEVAAQPNLIKVKNTSDVAVPQFGVLGIDDILFSPTDNLLGFKRQPVLKGVKPQLQKEDGTTHLGRFVVMAEPVDVNAIGMGCVSGVTPVKVDFGNATYNYADVYRDSVSYLRGGHAGSARVLWKEAGTGSKWALACLQSPAPYGFAKVTAMKTSSGADWTDFPTNNEYPLYVEANPCTDLIGANTDTTVILKLGINPSYQSGYSATAPTGMITMVGSTVGYLSFTCYKLASPSPYTFDGWVIPYMSGCWPDWTRAR